jgi:hypothetical protein
VAISGEPQKKTTSNANEMDAASCSNLRSEYFLPKVAHAKFVFTICNKEFALVKVSENCKQVRESMFFKDGRFEMLWLVVMGGTIRRISENAPNMYNFQCAMASAEPHFSKCDMESRGEDRHSSTSLATSLVSQTDDVDARWASQNHVAILRCLDKLSVSVRQMTGNNWAVQSDLSVQVESHISAGPTSPPVNPNISPQTVPQKVPLSSRLSGEYIAFTSSHIPNVNSTQWVPSSPSPLPPNPWFTYISDDTDVCHAPVKGTCCNKILEGSTRSWPRAGCTPLTKHIDPILQCPCKKLFSITLSEPMVIALSESIFVRNAIILLTMQLRGDNADPDVSWMRPCTFACKLYFFRKIFSFSSFDFIPTVSFSCIPLVTLTIGQLTLLLSLFWRVS